MFVPTFMIRIPQKMENEPSHLKAIWCYFQIMLDSSQLLLFNMSVYRYFYQLRFFFKFGHVICIPSVVLHICEALTLTHTVHTQTVKLFGLKQLLIYSCPKNIFQTLKVWFCFNWRISTVLSSLLVFQLPLFHRIWCSDIIVCRLILKILKAAWQSRLSKKHLCNTW